MIGGDPARSGPIPRGRPTAASIARGTRHPQLRDGVLYLSSSVAFQGARLAATLVAAAVLGPVDFGLWALVVAVLAYTPFATIGIVNAMNRDVPIYLGQARTLDARESEEAALGASLASALLLLPGMAAAALVLGADPVFAVFFGLAAALQQVAFCYQATLRARIRFHDAAIQQFAMAAVFLALALPGLALVGLTGLIIAQAATYGLVAVVSSAHWRRDLKPSVPAGILRQQARTGFPIAMSGLAFAALASQDRWVVAIQGTPEDLGHYALASTIASGLILLLLVIGQQLYPRMGYALGQSGRDAAFQLAKRQSLIAFAATAAGGVGLVVATGAMVAVGLDAYQSSVLPLAILCVAATVLGLASGFTNLLVVVGRASRLVIVYVTGAGVALAVGYVLMGAGAGLSAPALGSLVGSVVVALGAAALVRS